MGAVGGSRHYDGGGIGPLAGWDCPACGTAQSGPLEAGCASCGSGRPGHKVAEAPPRSIIDAGSDLWDTHFGGARAAALSLNDAAEQWTLHNPTAGLVEAFIAGYLAAQGRTMTAPPVTADLPTLDVGGKSVRTIIAALEHFREHLLPAAEDEIATGEWCSILEVSDLIRLLKERL